MGITGAAKTEVRPKQQTAIQILLTMLIRMLTRYAQREAVDRHERKQRLATRQGALSFKVFEVKSMIFHCKLSHKCHSERSEAATQGTKSARPGFQSRINFRAILPRANEPRCFASLLMTSFVSLSKSRSVHEGALVASPLGEGERMKVRGWVGRATALVALTPSPSPSPLAGERRPTLTMSSPHQKSRPTCWETST